MSRSTRRLTAWSASIPWIRTPRTASDPMEPVDSRIISGRSIPCTTCSARPTRSTRARIASRSTVATMRFRSTCWATTSVRSTRSTTAPTTAGRTRRVIASTRRPPAASSSRALPIVATSASPATNTGTAATTSAVRAACARVAISDTVLNCDPAVRRRYRRRTRRAVRRPVLRATRLHPNTVGSSSTLSASADTNLTGLELMQLLRVRCRHHADGHQIERADEAVADPEPAGPDDGVAQPDRPVVLQKHERRSRVVGNLLEDVPRGLVRQQVASLGGELGARLRADGRALLAIEAEADQRTDLAVELDGLLTRHVAEMLGLELARRVLVDEKGVDDPDGAGLAQPCQLREDLTVEVRVVEAEDDELDRADGHRDRSSREVAEREAVATTGRAHHPERTRPPARRGPAPISPRAARAGPEGLGQSLLGVA